MTEEDTNSEGEPRDSDPTEGQSDQHDDGSDQHDDGSDQHDDLASEDVSDTSVTEDGPASEPVYNSTSSTATSTDAETDSELSSPDKPSSGTNSDTATPQTRTEPDETASDETASDETAPDETAPDESADTATIPERDALEPNVSELEETESNDDWIDDPLLGSNSQTDDSDDSVRLRALENESGILDETDDDPSNKGLFDDLLSSEPIFENKEVLRPSYTPHELPHRSDQINRMATILVAALRGETPSNILIYGKTGTGKTASAKFVSQELERTSEKYDVPCIVEYINCEVTDTQYRVLAQLANTFIDENQTLVDERIDRLNDLRERARDDPSLLAETPFSDLDAIDEHAETLQERLDEIEEVPMTGWPTDRVYTTFFEAVDFHERVVVIMLDEIDKLVEKSGDDTLYNLSRMNSELSNSRVSIMGISNDLKFTDMLDPRVKSSLGEEEIVFPPYDANQLRDILEHRAGDAFKPDALSPDVIPLCAAFAAQEHGDARRALDLLRTAGELAEREGVDCVEEAHVRKAQDKIELDRVVEVVRTLPTQSKLVLFAIILLERHGVHNVNTGEVYNIYKRLCEEIEADILTQRRVTDLISELDMLGIVNAVVVSKGRYGRTKEISLSVPIEDTERVLNSDSRLGEIDDVRPFVQSRFDD